MTVFESIVDECSQRASQKKHRGQETPIEHEEQDEEESPWADADDRVWTSSEYWEYVDQVLSELRKEARATEMTPAGRAKYLEVYVVFIPPSPLSHSITRSL